MSVSIVAAARLPVAWKMSSEIGMFVAVVRIVFGSTMQNRITIKKIVPLWIDSWLVLMQVHINASGKLT